MTNASYLKHLNGAIPKEDWNYTISSYAMVLEAWRRGLTVTFVNQNRKRAQQVYDISSKERTHRFSVARGDFVTREAIRVCVDKDLTKKQMLAHEVSTPRGEVFLAGVNREEIKAYAKQIGYPVVVKPKDGTGGKGVVTGIQDDAALDAALDYLYKDLKVTDIILETYVEGDDYRIYVLNGEVIAAFSRERAHVIGDGKSTIRKLIREKNKVRTEQAGLGGSSGIKIDNETKRLLSQKGYDEDTILASGEKIYLNSKNNVSAGGESTDKTDELTEDMKAIAIKAQKAVPGLIQCGVDMIINSDMTEGYVLEINSRPHIRSHLFPLNGQARDVPKAVIDFYFPETKGTPIKNLLYFDFQSMYETFVKGICASFTLPDHPMEDAQLARYELTKVASMKSLGLLVKNQALRLGVHGYIKRIGSGKVSLVLAGDAKKIEAIEHTIKKRYSGITLSNKPRQTPVCVGFQTIHMLSNVQPKQPVDTKSEETQVNQPSKRAVKSNPNDPNIEGYFPILIADSTSAPNGKISKKPVKKKKQVKTQSHKHSKNTNDYYKKKYENVVNSTSWRITKPMRRLQDVIKRLKRT